MILILDQEVDHPMILLDHVVIQIIVVPIIIQIIDLEHLFVQIIMRMIRVLVQDPMAIDQERHTTAITMAVMTINPNQGTTTAPINHAPDMTIINLDSTTMIQDPMI